MAAPANRYTGFDKCIRLCHSSSYQKIKHYYLPEHSLVPLRSPSPPQTHSQSFSSWLVVSILELRKNGITHMRSFCKFLSLRMLLLRFTPVFPCVRTLIPFIAKIRPGHTYSCRHPLKGSREPSHRKRPKFESNSTLL